MPDERLELLLFTSNPWFANLCGGAGVDGFIIDWESKGKTERQRGHDMEIGVDTVADLSKLAASVSRPITVRINALGQHTGNEIAAALDNGASGIMLPMAEAADQADRFLQMVAGRARTIVQVETQALVEDLARFADLPWDAAYIGLHDLMLSRQATSMWQAILDGTVDKVFETLHGRCVGFAGATVIGGGHPIRFTQVLQELARLGASLTFLRRSFRREILDRDLVSEINALRATWLACQARGPTAVEADRDAFHTSLRRLA